MPIIWEGNHSDVRPATLVGRIEEEVRLPLLPVTPATGEVIRSAMVHAGLLNA